MDFTVLLVLVILTLLVYLAFTRLFSNDKFNLPPGPKGYPFLGSYLDLKPRVFLALENLGKQYGPIFTVQVGLRKIVVLHSYEALKESLVNQGSIFSGRLKNSLVEKFSRNQGIIVTDGESWKRQRRTALQILKDYGFGREKSKQIIQNEVEDAIAIIKSKNGQPIVTQHFFGDCTANIINAIAVNERPAHVDTKFQEVLQCFDKIVQFSFLGQFTIFFPFIMKIPYLFNLLDLKRKRVKIGMTCNEYVIGKVEDHKKVFDPEQEPKDFIDSMLLLQKEAEASEPGYKKDLYEFRIARTIFELFIAGNDTTATTLSWMFLLLALYPDVQKKMQDEIDNVCGKTDPIKMESKKLMPYVSAVIDEVMRFASIAPLGVMHRATENAKVFGFDIPKDTLLITHIYAVHHDPTYWEKPNQFYPEHFLTSDGKEYKPNDHLVPFSLGPRSCMGEILANLELFILSTSVIREFSMELNGNYSAEAIKELLIGNEGQVRRLNHHEITFRCRQKD